MRYLLLMLTLMIPGLTGAKDLCSENSEIAVHSRIPESHLNRANARAALQVLDAIVVDGRAPHAWTEVPNALKVVEGYIRKKEYLDNRDSAIGNWKLSEFCFFMQHSGWWYE